jgi:hypothetical protein
MRAGGIVLGAEDSDIVAPLELAAEAENVNLRASRVPRQEIMDGMKDPQDDGSLALIFRG